MKKPITPPDKPLHHNVKPGSSLSWSDDAFHHKVEPGSTFEGKEPKISPTPGQAQVERTIRSMLTPELAEMFPDQSQLDSLIGPAEQMTLQRIIDKKLKPGMPPMDAEPLSDRVQSGTPLDPAPPSPPPIGLGPKAQSPREHLAHAKLRLSKQRARLKLKNEIRKHGPQGEQLSQRLSDKPTVMLPLDKIGLDPGFKYFRLPPTPEERTQLIMSMRTEGIMIPIKVIPNPANSGTWLLRSGFRRVEAARYLGWRHVPAIILPDDLPEDLEYWGHIIENSGRNLHAYEVAKAAKLMRDDFKIGYKEFALRAGYDDHYIDNLLRAIDRLPPEIVDKWAARERVPFEFLYEWSTMMPTEALKAYNVYAGLHPNINRIKDVPVRPPTPRERILYKELTASDSGLKRMQGARDALEMSTKFDPVTQDFGLKIIDFCMGARTNIPGVYDHAMEAKMARRRSRARKLEPEPDPEPESEPEPG
jgi:ParB/RepB/Spo0J family partition protein